MEIHVLVTKVRGLRRDGRSIFMKLLARIVAVGGRLLAVVKSVRRSAMRGYVRTFNLSLNSAIKNQLLDRSAEDKANATSSA